MINKIRNILATVQNNLDKSFEKNEQQHLKKCRKLFNEIKDLFEDDEISFLSIEIAKKRLKGVYSSQYIEELCEVNRKIFVEKLEKMDENTVTCKEIQNLLDIKSFNKV